ncbi:fatty acid desaturase [Undibacterium sp. TS12]|uniref:fatty acid desaturase n=1 Tax=Undibacterium sp. TS12 TaxID=2908202 RepID=UPI001F4CCF08|nr:fatty acid desaturase [Undibacterium sp. TS12]MCH8618036.1 fatty acid desaturase [Undibacterium sp. TS12]
MKKDSSKSHKCKKHPFASHLVAYIRQLHVTDNYHGFLELLNHWFFITSAIFLSSMAWKYFSTPGAALTYLLVLVHIGGRQRSLADVLHQASHLTLAKNRMLNNVLGTIFSGYFVFQSLTGYRATHGKGHHGHFGDPENDPDFKHLTEVGLCGVNRTPVAVIKFVIGLFSISSIYKYLVYLTKNRIFPMEESRAERTGRLLFYTSITVALIYYDLMFIFFFYWIIPLITTQAWIGASAELSEHFPMIDCEDRIDIITTRNRHCGNITNFILGLRKAEGLHLVHHLFPGLPAWHAVKAHEVLMADPSYRSVNLAIGHGWKQIFLEIISAQTNLSEIYANSQISDVDTMK